MQMATSIEADNGEMIVKRVSVPIGLEELMEGLTKEVMLKKPKDIYVFASEYFAKLLNLREKGSLKATPGKRVQSVTRQIPIDNMSKHLKMKSKSVEPIRQLPRQKSIRPESPTKKTLTTRKIILGSNEKTSDKAKSFLDRRRARKDSKDDSNKKQQKMPMTPKDKKSPRKSEENVKTPRRGSQQKLSSSKSKSSQDKKSEKGSEDKENSAGKVDGVQSNAAAVATAAAAAGVLINDDDKILQSDVSTISSNNLENLKNENKNMEKLDPDVLENSNDKPAGDACVGCTMNDDGAVDTKIENKQEETIVMPLDVEKIETNEGNKSSINKIEEENLSSSVDEVDKHINADIMEKSDTKDEEEAFKDNDNMVNIPSNDNVEQEAEYQGKDVRTEEKKSTENLDSFEKHSTSFLEQTQNDEIVGNLENKILPEDATAKSEELENKEEHDSKFENNGDNKLLEKGEDAADVATKVPDKNDINEENKVDKLSDENVNKENESSMKEHEKIEEPEIIASNNMAANNSTKIEENEKESNEVTNEKEIKQPKNENVLSEQAETNNVDTDTVQKDIKLNEENSQYNYENKENIDGEKNHTASNTIQDVSSGDNSELTTNVIKTAALNLPIKEETKDSKTEKADDKPKVKNIRTKSLSEERLQAKDNIKELNKPKRMKSVDSSKKNNFKKTNSKTKIISPKEQNDNTEENTGKDLKDDKDKKKRSKRSASVDVHKTTKVVDNVKTTSFDSSKLREEIKTASEISKATNYKTSYNPYKLRQEIKQASQDSKIEESNKLSKVAGEVAAAIKIQSMWRAFSVRKRKINQPKKDVLTNTAINEKKTEDVKLDVATDSSKELVVHEVEHNKEDSATDENIDHNFVDDAITDANKATLEDVTKELDSTKSSFKNDGEAPQDSSVDKSDENETKAGEKIISEITTAPEENKLQTSEDGKSGGRHEDSETNRIMEGDKETATKLSTETESQSDQEAKNKSEEKQDSKVNDTLIEKEETINKVTATTSPNENKVKVAELKSDTSSAFSERDEKDIENSYTLRPEIKSNVAEGATAEENKEVEGNENNKFKKEEDATETVPTVNNGKSDVIVAETEKNTTRDSITDNNNKVKTAEVAKDDVTAKSKEETEKVEASTADKENHKIIHDEQVSNKDPLIITKSHQGEITPDLVEQGVKADTKETKHDSIIKEPSDPKDIKTEVTEVMAKSAISTVHEKPTNKSNVSQEDVKEKEKNLPEVSDNKIEKQADHLDVATSSSKNHTKLDMADAVLRIQAVWRGFRVRKQLEHETLFGTTVKMEPKTKEPAEILKKMDRTKAVSKIQAVWRGYKVRKNIKEVNNRLAELQKPEECDEMPSQRGLSDEDILKAATKIQAGVRGYMVRKKRRNISKLNSITEESTPESKLSDEHVVESLDQLHDIPNNSPEIVNDLQFNDAEPIDQSLTHDSEENNFSDKDKLDAPESKTENTSNTENVQPEATRNTTTIDTKEDNKKTDNGVKFIASELNSSSTNKLSNLDTCALIDDSISNSTINKDAVDPISSTIHDAPGYEDAPTRPVTSDTIPESTNNQTLSDRNEPPKQDKEQSIDCLKEQNKKNVNMINEINKKRSEQELLSSQESSASVDSIATVIFNDTETQPDGKLSPNDNEEKVIKMKDNKQETVENINNKINVAVVKQELIDSGKAETKSDNLRNDTETKQKAETDIKDAINGQEGNDHLRNEEPVEHQTSTVLEQLPKSEKEQSTDAENNKSEEMQTNNLDQTKLGLNEASNLLEINKDEGEVRSVSRSVLDGNEKSNAEDKDDKIPAEKVLDAQDNTETKSESSDTSGRDVYNKLNIPALENEIKNSDKKFKNMTSKSSEELVDLGNRSREHSLDISTTDESKTENSLSLSGNDDVKSNNTDKETIDSKHKEIDSKSEEDSLRKHIPLGELSEIKEEEVDVKSSVDSVEDLEDESKLNENENQNKVEQGIKDITKNVNESLSELEKSETEKNKMLEKKEITNGEKAPEGKEKEDNLEIKETHADAAAPKESAGATISLVHSGEFHDRIVLPISVSPPSSRESSALTEKNKVLKKENITNEDKAEGKQEEDKKVEVKGTHEDAAALKETRQKSAGATISLVHSGEFHDKITVPISVSPPRTRESPAADRQTSPQGLVHSGELHDNVLPLSVQLNEAPPAGAEVLTSLVSDSINTDGQDRAQASNKDASTCEAQPDNTTSSAASMETEKRNNATTIPKKSMEAEAATKIQAGFRGYQVRKQLKSKISAPGDISNQRRSARRKSSGRISESGRMMHNKPKTTDLDKDKEKEKEKSAVKIQAGVRGFLVRRRQKKQKQGKESS